MTIQALLPLDESSWRNESKYDPRMVHNTIEEFL